MNAIVKRAGELLVGVTPGVWELEDEEDSSYTFVVGPNDEIVAKLHGTADAEVIIACRNTLVQQLCEEVVRLEEECATETRLHNDLCDRMEKVQAEKDTELTILRGVVEKVREYAGELQKDGRTVTWLVADHILSLLPKEVI